MLKDLLGRPWIFRFLMSALALLLLASALLWWVLAPRPRTSWKVADGGASDRPPALRVFEGGKMLEVLGKKNSFWNIDSRDQLRALASETQAHIHMITPDGRWAIVNDDGGVIVMDMTQATDPFLLTGSSRTMELWAESQVLMTSQDDGTVKVWDLKTAKALPTPGWKTADVAILGEYSNVVLAVEVTKDNAIVWDVKKQVKLLTVARDFDSWQVSANGRCLAAGNRVAVKFWEVQSGKELASIPFKPNDTWPLGISLSSDGSKVLIAGDQGGAFLWNIVEVPPRKISQYPGIVEFSPDGSFVLATFANHFELWDPELSQKKVGETVGLRLAAFSPDGKMLAFTAPPKPVLRSIKNYVPWSFGGNEIRIMDPYTGNELASIPGEEFSWFPDNSAIATYRSDGVVQIWDLPLRRPLLVDYGFPVLFVLPATLAWRYWYWMRQRRRVQPLP